MAEPFAANSGSSYSAVELQRITEVLNQIASIQAQLTRNSANSSQDPTNPYFLHPSESAGTPLIPVILDGKNYGSWSRSMVLALKSKNKLKFIDGSLPKPDENDSVFESWERCNTYVVAWINLSLSPSISQSVIWMNVASDLWNDLKHRYYHGDRFRVAELHEKFYAFRQGDVDVTTYFTKLRAIWEDIENFRMIPSCESGKTAT
ncbi:uncharacterized protein LOC107646220 [Arachis ipaensis]|uniref:uncharacterized protein LOC107646220 n=1 Tax=Arachis ipaensis TaxID=130454 RepID=UPI0007AF7ACF|nr:uncharacterized protein LOC107646220 [Arachis ipaensis]